MLEKVTNWTSLRLESGIHKCMTCIWHPTVNHQLGLSLIFYKTLEINYCVSNRKEVTQPAERVKMIYPAICLHLSMQLRWRNVTEKQTTWSVHPFFRSHVLPALPPAVKTVWTRRDTPMAIESFNQKSLSKLCVENK